MNCDRQLWSTSAIAPTASRRSVVLGVAVASIATRSTVLSDYRLQPDTAPVPDPAFLALSRSLLGRDDLDATTAARLAAAFANVAPAVHARFADLAHLRACYPRALLAAAASHRLKFAALAIVSAWHAASVGPTLLAGSHDMAAVRPARDAGIRARSS